MTRPFRNAANRCPIRGSSQKLRPALEFFSQERRSEDWFPPTSSGFLDQRTKLLTPSVVHLPVFKVNMNYNDRGVLCQNTFITSMRFFLVLENIFFTAAINLLRVLILGAPPRLTWFAGNHSLWITHPLLFVNDYFVIPICSTVALQ
jgi:hypothetical protein